MNFTDIQQEDILYRIEIWFDDPNFFGEGSDPDNDLGISRGELITFEAKVRDNKDITLTDNEREFVYHEVCDYYRGSVRSNLDKGDPDYYSMMGYLSSLNSLEKKIQR